ncbi:MAG: ComF family protein [Saccharospirillum sp.]
MKYQSDLACARSLAALWWQQQRPAKALDALIPVPMHARRLRKRGFNQAEWLARYWSKPSGIPVWTEAFKPQPTDALEGLNRSERRKVLRGAFALRERPPKRVAIVDDVFTTGSTCSELARLLRRNGASHIEVWALARTPLQ